MFYIIKNKKIVLADASKEKLEATIMFMPQYKDLEIKSTSKEIILFNNEFFFKDDVESEYLQELKDNKIKELKSYCQEVIYDKYPAHRQTNISLLIDGWTSEDKKEMKTFIETNIHKCDTLEEKISELDESSIKTFNVKEEWDKLDQESSNEEPTNE